MGDYPTIRINKKYILTTTNEDFYTVPKMKDIDDYYIHIDLEEERYKEECDAIFKENERQQQELEKMWRVHWYKNNVGEGFEESRRLDRIRNENNGIDLNSK